MSVLFHNAIVVVIPTTAILFSLFKLLLMIDILHDLKYHNPQLFIFVYLYIYIYVRVWGHAGLLSQGFYLQQYEYMIMNPVATSQPAAKVMTDSRNSFFQGPGRDPEDSLGIVCKGLQYGPLHHGSDFNRGP